MKKVSIITRHNVLNYGSVLQAFATQEVVKNLGYDPVVVDYRRCAETLDSLVKRYSEGRSLPHRIYRNTVWRLLYSAGEKRFKSMREQYLTLSPHCDETSIDALLPNTDIYLTGSDQVWNELGDGSLDPVFFWDGLSKVEGKKVVSYAASFGRGGVVKGYESQIGNWLKRYDAISVREDSGKDIVESYGLKAEQVLDPTLLLNRSEWNKIASKKAPVEKPYALVYNLHPDSDMLQYVKDKTAGSNLEIVSVCPTFRRRVGKQVVLPPLEDFLALFRDASCVYTDSFHGTAFCINLGTPFVEIFPKANAARNKSVLRLFGLENRAWDTFQGNAWDDDIDWQHVGEVLDGERNRSLSWLDRALKE